MFNIISHTLTEQLTNDPLGNCEFLDKGTGSVRSWRTWAAGQAGG